MPTGAPQRRLATFLFLDVVGSTALASQLGDRRWRDLLQRFRRSVRGAVKAGGGREEDWAGDGLFATFAEPGPAIRAAVEIVRSVQELGLEVRCGIHTAEAETVDGKLAGIGVHVAARIMALGGAAEVLTSGTVRDLVAGARIEFDERGVHELKGVPGTWPVFRVRALDDESVPEPLEPDEAASRIEAVEPSRGGRHRAAILLGAGAIGMAVVLVVVLALTQERGKTDADGEVDAPGTVTVAAIDTDTGRASPILRDGAYSEHLWGILSVEDGYLWQATRDTLVQRDLASGAIEHTLDIPAGWISLDGGFGYVWGTKSDPPQQTEIFRINPISGKTKTFTVPGEPADLRAGNGSLWLLATDGTLTEIDPVTLKVVNTYDTGTTTPGIVVPLAGYVWICECESGRVAQFDPRTNQVVRELDLPEHGYVFGVESTTPSQERVWLLDPEANTLTPIDPSTGEAGRPVGVGGATITDATIVGDSLWVSSQTEVTEIELASLDHHVFPVPEGISAGSIAPVPDEPMVWVANCGCPIQD
jgi:class 3 adenylate cyclase